MPSFHTFFLRTLCDLYHTYRRTLPVNSALSKSVFVNQRDEMQASLNLLSMSEKLFSFHHRIIWSRYVDDCISIV